MKILVTGAHGILGSAFTLKLGSDCIGTSRSQLDLTNLESVRDFFKKHEVSTVIHCAANTNLEFCETNPEQSFLDNVQATMNVFNAFKKLNPRGKFVFISSTGIYGSEVERPYTEDDVPVPTTVHHINKKEAEDFLISQKSEVLIIRTGWLFGGSVNHNKNFVYKRYLEASKSLELVGDKSQFGNPTYVKDVVYQVIKMINMGCCGIYNCVNIGSVSRYDYVNEIISLFNLNTKLIPAPKSFFKRIAPVSKNEMAINKRLIDEEICIMNNWKDSLANYIKDLKKEIQIE